MSTANMGGPTSRALRSACCFILGSGEHEQQGFYGHVIGGMGAITQALAASGQKLGVSIRTSAQSQGSTRVAMAAPVG